MRLSAFLLFWVLVFCGCAHAQNPQCQFTPAPGTSDQLCASTAFVQAAVGASGAFTPTRVANDFSSSTTVLANVTGLSVNVTTGLTYYFDVYLACTDAGAGGVAAAIGGTAVATSFISDGWVHDANLIKGQNRTTSMGVGPGSATAQLVPIIIMHGTITVTSSGTLTVQFAQFVGNATASVVKQGSTFFVWSVP
jgi:hypothetical protein